MYLTLVSTVKFIVRPLRERCDLDRVVFVLRVRVFSVAMRASVLVRHAGGDGYAPDLGGI